MLVLMVSYVALAFSTVGSVHWMCSAVVVNMFYETHVLHGTKAKTMMQSYAYHRALLCACLCSHMLGNVQSYRSWYGQWVGIRAKLFASSGATCVITRLIHHMYMLLLIGMLTAGAARCQ
jgi:hypothetical protein